MIEFKIGYVGKADDMIYQKAEEFFKEKNNGDKDFTITFEDITNMSAEEIDSNTYHMIVFDKNSIDDKMMNVIHELKNSRADITDINFLPYAREEITRDEIQENNRKLKEILDVDINSIPVNVSDPRDIQGYLDAMYISAVEYKEMVNGVVLEVDEVKKNITEQVLEAIKRKDEIAGNQYVTYDHVRNVGEMTKKFATYYGYDQDKIDSMEYVAMVHDTGKIVIPTDILYAGLTLGNEVQQMNPHDELGTNILRNENLLTSEEAKGVKGHHGKEGVR